MLYENGFCDHEYGNIGCKEETGECVKCSCSDDHVITSPNFPKKYPKNVEITWLIKFPSGQRIKIKFISFSTEDSPGCVKW